MSKFVCQSFTDYKNIIASRLINDSDLVKAISNYQSDFLDKPLIEDVSTLLYNNIFTYEDVGTIVDEKVYITMAFRDFEPVDQYYKKGDIYFYIIIPNNLVRSDYGLRYDFIGDRLEKLFAYTKGMGLGKLELKKRSDLRINEKYKGSYLKFHVTDLSGW